MSKKYKGFTLMELIIVMAILVILMAGIMQMFKPIREVYLDSTLYESQRTTQNGIQTYINETVKGATNYSFDNTSASAEAAVDAFIAQNPNLAVRTTPYKIYILYIDNADNGNDNTLNGNTYKGRLFKATTEVEVSGDATNPYKLSSAGISSRRLVFGKAYYGPYSYSISVVPAVDKSLLVTVSSLLSKKNAEQTNIDTNQIEAAKNVSTENLALSNNVKNSGGVAFTGNFDPSKPTTSQNKVSYLVYTTVNRELEGVPVT